MQQENRFKAQCQRLYARYDQWMEKQGFTVVLVVCVLVIAMSALYTFYFREKWAEDEDVQPETMLAGGNQQAQTLQEAQQLVTSQANLAQAAPTEAPFCFSQPLAGFLERDFSMQEPQYFPRPNYWRLHPGVDLTAEYGTLVAACEKGTVLRVWEDAELGLCVRIRHGYGYEAVYAGLSDASYVKQGDPVRLGQTIGHVGNGVVAESDAQPHLHLEVWLGDTPVDPVELFLGVEH